MREFRLTCHTVPVAQPRQRHGVINGHVRNWTPKDHPVQAFKAALQLAIAQSPDKPPAPLQGPLFLEVYFYMPRPQSLMRKKDPPGPIPHIKKPDVDNLVKAVWDALNGLLWRDDSQIWHIDAAKWYAGKDELPRVELAVYDMGSGGP